MFHLKLTYYNPVLNIAFNHWQQVYLLSDKPILLKPCLHRGALVYRMPATGKRISYRQIKQHLLKQTVQFLFDLLPVAESIKKQKPF